MRKFIIISLQVQPALVGCANHAEAKIVVAVVRVVVVPVRNRTVVSVIVPAGTTVYAVRAGRSAGSSDLRSFR